MTNINEWVLDNLVIAILLNIILGAAFICVLVWCGYTLFKKHRLSPFEWLIVAVTLILGIVAYVLTGMNESPIHL